ncbi:MAG: hypothetical protein LBC06_01135 [Rickettsiales bacterium]|jgi:hypothetical protein|nr:hypothetical protein [Rickettsiales bacterium]
MDKKEVKKIKKMFLTPPTDKEGINSVKSFINYLQIRNEVNKIYSKGAKEHIEANNV